ncbi:MAG: GAF domain-containing protein [Gammaproteobacteria bacterium]|nr:GAF domain-containing protein [Gammaproteobacteria bacterium]
MQLTPEQRDACNEMLNLGREALGLEMGIVSHIDNNLYTIEAVDSDGGVFVPGETFALKDTLCREVIGTGRSVSLSSYNGSPGLRGHPLYESLQLEAYIAAPIIVNENIWGTVNFTSLKVRATDFSESEMEYVRECAYSVGGMIVANG